MQNRYKIRIIIFLFSGWALFVIWNFFGSFPFFNLPAILLNGAMLLILLLFFTALGKRIFHILNISFASFSEECSFSFGLGSGIIIFLVIGLAAIGLLYKGLLVAVVLGLYGLVYNEARSLCRQGCQACGSIFIKKKTFEAKVCFLFIGLATIVTFLAAATPPFFYDALVYHLALPHKYLLRHGFHALPYFHPSAYPANLGMLFAVALSFSGGMLAKLFSWCFVPMTVVSVYAFAKSRWGNHVAIISATITMLTPAVLIISTLTTVDTGVMFYSSLSFFALVSWFTHRQKHWLFFSSLFCSLAVGTKYTAIVTTGMPLAFFLCIHEYFLQKQSLLHTLRKVAIVIGIIICGASPWLIKNIMYVGNPLHPLFHSFFSQKAPVAEYQKLQHDEASQIAQWFDFFKRCLKAPWTTTMTAADAGGKTGVLFLLFFPCVFLINKLDMPLKYLIAISGFSFFLWFVLLPRVLRYAFPVFPLFSVVTAYLCWHISTSDRLRRWIFGGISLMFLYHMLLFGAEEAKLQAFTYLFGNKLQKEFLLEHGVTQYPIFEYINSETPLDSKILFVAELRGFYCNRDYLVHHVIENDNDALRNLILESQNIAELIRKLRERGITHILVSESEMQRFTKMYFDRDSYFGFQTEKDRRIFRNLFSSQHLRPLISQYQVNLYEVIY